MVNKTMLTRRNALKGLGTLTVAGTGLGGALLATSPAAAQSYAIQDSEVSITDGQVSYVAVDAAGTLTWGGFDVPAAALTLRAEVRLPEQSTGWHLLHETTSDTFENWSGDGDSDGWGGPGEYVVSLDDPGAGEGRAGEIHTNANWNVIGAEDETLPPEDGGARSVEDPAPWQSNVSVDEDGATETFTVEKRSTVVFLDSDLNPLSADEAVQQVQDTATFSVEVTNEESSTGGSTSGTSTAG